MKALALQIFVIAVVFLIPTACLAQQDAAESLSNPDISASNLYPKMAEIYSLSLAKTKIALGFWLRPDLAEEFALDSGLNTLNLLGPWGNPESYFGNAAYPIGQAVETYIITPRLITISIDF